MFFLGVAALLSVVGGCFASRGDGPQEATKSSGNPRGGMFEKIRNSGYIVSSSRLLLAPSRVVQGAVVPLHTFLSWLSLMEGAQLCSRGSRLARVYSEAQGLYRLNTKKHSGSFFAPSSDFGLPTNTQQNAQQKTTVRAR